MSILLKNQSPFGLDISDRSLRLVALRKDHHKKNHLASFAELRLDKGIIDNGEIINQAKLRNSLKQLLNNVKGNKLTTNEIITSLPELTTFIKLIKIDKVPENKIRASINSEISSDVPLSLENMCIDWQVIDQEARADQILVQVAAAPKQTVDSYTSILESVNLLPSVLEVEAASISRSLFSEEVNSALRSPGAIMVIDLGATRTSLFMYNHGVIHLSLSLPISGINLTQKIAKNLKIDPAEAERTKVSCGFDRRRCKEDVKKILYGTIDQLTKSINKVKGYYEQTFPDHDHVGKIMLCGGGSYLLGIERVLSEKVSIPTILADPTINLDDRKINKFNFPTERSLSFTTAIGLALRGIEINDL